MWEIVLVGCIVLRSGPIPKLFDFISSGYYYLPIFGLAWSLLVALVTLSGRGSGWKQFVKSMGASYNSFPQFYNEPNHRTFSLECRCLSSEHSRLTKLLLFSAQRPSIFFAPFLHETSTHNFNSHVWVWEPKSNYIFQQHHKVILFSIAHSIFPSPVTIKTKRKRENKITINFLTMRSITSQSSQAVGRRIRKTY
jgi:hypothetical protein